MSDIETRKGKLKEAATLMGKELGDDQAEAMVVKALKLGARNQMLASVARLGALLGAGAAGAHLLGLAPVTGIGVVAVYSCYQTACSIVSALLLRSQTRTTATMFAEMMAVSRDKRASTTTVSDLYPTRGPNAPS